ncbi:MAG TPA: DUF5689 domain-containing protein [Rhodothermales bacterium]|nr:DUF5689 domain-containing protein [Rhodothermales bacterium]
MRFVPALLGLVVLPLATRAQTPEPIGSVRTKALGTIVTVGGRVTVAREFGDPNTTTANPGGPVHLQDATGGLGIYYTDLARAVERGDSIIVTGPLSEFQARTGQPGTGQLQITCTPTPQSPCSFRIVDGPRVQVVPRVVTFAQIDESLESQLVLVRNVRYNATGVFGANQNLTNVQDGTGTMAVRSDADTNVPGAPIPTGAVDLVAIVGHAQNIRQLLPRSAADVGVAPATFPGETISRARTFEVATWNVEFFGDNGPIGTDPDAGPDDEDLQIRNAARVLRAIDADLYGLQEIVSTAAFGRLVDSLNVGRQGAFRGFIAPIRQIAAGEDPAENGQKTAFIYRTATVDSVSAGFLFTSGDWAFCCTSGVGGGRYPYSFVFDAKVEGTTRRINAVVIHAKAGSSQADYQDRMRDIPQLKAALDARPNEAIILLGDYNDDVDVSTYAGQPSPYAAFAQHAGDTCAAGQPYCTVTRLLSDQRQNTTSSGSQVIDHITISNELYADYFAGTVRKENTAYVPFYSSTTSDHFPVWARFDLARITAAETDLVSSPSLLAGLYPNPARSRLVVTVTTPASVALFDALGREVLRTVAMVPGPVTLPLATVAPGVYVVHVTVGTRAEARVVVVR